MADDRRCQWCHKVVAVATGDDQWVAIADTVALDGKWYCDGASGKCWSSLVALEKFVYRRHQIHD